MNLKTTGLLCALLLVGCAPEAEVSSATNSEIRIISTAPALTELICAVGASASLVGRTDVCNYPPEIVESIPIAGKFAVPNIERVIALRTTHLLESALINPAQTESLERFNIKVEHIDYSRISDIPPAIRRTGEITTHTLEAQTLAREVENGLNQLAVRAKEMCDKPRTLILLDHMSPITCGTNTFISEIAALAGADNIATSLKKEYDYVSLEWIVEQDPTLIICFFEIKVDPVKFFRERAGWKKITAVREGRIIIPQNLDAICRPGPRVIAGIRELRTSIEKIMQDSSPRGSPP